MTFVSVSLTYVYHSVLKVSCESASRHSQPKGGTHDCEIFANLRLTFVSSSREWTLHWKSCSLGPLPEQQGGLRQAVLGHQWMVGHHMQPLELQPQDWRMSIASQLQWTTRRVALGFWPGVQKYNSISTDTKNL